jgi:hypothetical protein
MNLTIAKGTPPTYSPNISLTNLGGGQYGISAVVSNAVGPTANAQVLFYWAAAAYPTTSPQLFGWTLGAYVQPLLIPPEPNPTPLPPGTSVPAGGSNSFQTLWVPDAGVTNMILTSYDPAHIMIIAQVIQLTPTVMTHPTDFSWWIGGGAWVAAGVFSWP